MGSTWAHISMVGTIEEGAKEIISVKNYPDQSSFPCSIQAEKLFPFNDPKKSNISNIDCWTNIYMTYSGIFRGLDYCEMLSF